MTNITENNVLSDNKRTFKINELGKLELYFTFDDFKNLNYEDKKQIKDNFLWSNAKKAWISKGKYSQFGYMPLIIKKHNFIFEGKEDRLSFEDKVNNQSENAENKASKYETKALNSEEKAKRLQARFNELRKDWSWLTQPNINSSAGRSFTNRRNKVLNSYEKGLEEYKKSQYYQEKSEQLKKSSENNKYNNLAYLGERLKEVNKSISEYEKNNNIENTQKRLENENITENQILNISLYLDRYQEQIEKKAFYLAKIEKLSDEGTTIYNKENLKDALYVKRRGDWHQVIKLNEKTVTISWFVGNWKADYTEIEDALYTKDDFNIQSSGRGNFEIEIKNRKAEQKEFDNNDKLIKQRAIAKAKAKAKAIVKSLEIEAELKIE